MLITHTHTRQKTESNVKNTLFYVTSTGHTGRRHHSIPDTHSMWDGDTGDGAVNTRRATPSTSWTQAHGIHVTASSRGAHPFKRLLSTCLFVVADPPRLRLSAEARTAAAAGGCCWWSGRWRRPATPLLLLLSRPVGHKKTHWGTFIV